MALEAGRFHQIFFFDLNDVTLHWLLLYGNYVKQWFLLICSPFHMYFFVLCAYVILILFLNYGLFFFLFPYFTPLSQGMPWHISGLHRPTCRCQATDPCRCDNDTPLHPTTLSVHLLHASGNTCSLVFFFSFAHCICKAADQHLNLTCVSHIRRGLGRRVRSSLLLKLFS